MRFGTDNRRKWSDLVTELSSCNRQQGVETNFEADRHLDATISKNMGAMPAAVASQQSMVTSLAGSRRQIIKWTEKGNLFIICSL